MLQSESPRILISEGDTLSADLANYATGLVFAFRDVHIPVFNDSTGTDDFRWGVSRVLRKQRAGLSLQRLAWAEDMEAK
jgi:hypothetical protein